MQSVLAAFRFLAVGGRFDEAKSRHEASALAALFFPLVGLVVGLILAIVNRAFEPHLESELLAVALTATMLLITRAVHLDGTLQTFETLTYRTAFSERARPAHVQGWLVVLLVVLLKIRAIEVIGDTRTMSLLLTPVFARWSLVIFLYGAAPDAEDFVAAVARNVKGWQLLVTTAATLAFAVYLVGRTGLWVGLYVSLFSLLMRSVLRRFHGAYTYHNLGALIELSEALSLVLFASLQGIAIRGPIPWNCLNRFLLTEKYGPDPQLAASIAMLSTFISVLTIPIVLWLILQTPNEISKKVLDRY